MNAKDFELALKEFAEKRKCRNEANSKAESFH